MGKKQENVIVFGIVSTALLLILGWFLFGLCATLEERVTLIKACVLYEPNGHAAYLVKDGQFFKAVNTIAEYESLNRAISIIIEKRENINLYGGNINPYPTYQIAPNQHAENQ
jgi:hypothetical protein